MRIVRVRAIIPHEGKFLFVKLKKAPHFWCLPGGGVDESEQLEKALERELIEELGVQPKMGQLLYVHQFQDGDIEQLEFIFSVSNGQDYLYLDLSKTSHGELELAEAGFIDPTSEVVLPKFLPEELPMLDTDTIQAVRFFSYL